MRKECTVAFKVTEEVKDKIIKLAGQHKTADVSHPLTLSDFCRVAVSKFIKEIEGNKVKP